MLFSFCVAFERYIITKRITQIPIAIPAKNQRCQLPLSAEAKSRAVVTRIMQIKRREQPYRIPQSEILEDQVFAAQIDNQHDYYQP